MGIVLRNYMDSSEFFVVALYQETRQEGPSKFLGKLRSITCCKVRRKVRNRQRALARKASAIRAWIVFLFDS